MKQFDDYRKERGWSAPLLLHPRPRVDRLRFDLAMLDLTALGRQEDWEESPAADPHTLARFDLTHEN